MTPWVRVGEISIYVTIVGFLLSEFHPSLWTGWMFPLGLFGIWLSSKFVKRPQE